MDTMDMNRRMDRTEMNPYTTNVYRDQSYESNYDHQGGWYDSSSDFTSSPPQNDGLSLPIAHMLAPASISYEGVGFPSSSITSLPPSDQVWSTFDAHMYSSPPSTGLVGPGYYQQPSTGVYASNHQQFGNSQWSLMPQDIAQYESGLQMPLSSAYGRDEGFGVFVDGYGTISLGSYPGLQDMLPPAQMFLQQPHAAVSYHGNEDSLMGGLTYSFMGNETSQPVQEDGPSPSLARNPNARIQSSPPFKPSYSGWTAVNNGPSSSCAQPNKARFLHNPPKVKKRKRASYDPTTPNTLMSSQEHTKTRFERVQNLSPSPSPSPLISSASSPPTSTRSVEDDPHTPSPRFAEPENSKFTHSSSQHLSVKDHDPPSPVVEVPVQPTIRRKSVKAKTKAKKVPSPPAKESYRPLPVQAPSPPAKEKKTAKRKKASAPAAEDDDPASPAKTMAPPAKRQKTARPKKLSSARVVDSDQEDAGHESDAPREGRYTEDELRLLGDAVRAYREEHQLTEYNMNELLGSNARENDFPSGLWDQICGVLPHRERHSIQKAVKRKWNNLKKGPWTVEDDEELKELHEMYPSKWQQIGIENRRGAEASRDRWRNYGKNGAKQEKGEWPQEQEQQLLDLIRSTVVRLAEERELDSRAGKQVANEFDLTEYLDFGVLSSRMGGVRSRLQCRNKWAKLKKRQVAMDYVHEALNKQNATIGSTPTMTCTKSGPSSSALKEAQRNFHEKMLPGDKYYVLLGISRIMEARNIRSEANIPWDEVQAADKETKWTIDDRKVVFREMQIMYPSDPNQNAFKRVESLVSELEAELHPEELERHYGDLETPAKKKQRTYSKKGKAFQRHGRPEELLVTPGSNDEKEDEDEMVHGV